MLVTLRYSTADFQASVAATERALYASVKDIAEQRNTYVRGIYYNRIKDPMNGFSLIEIRAWLR